MRRYETVLFDLDGTLLNTLEDLKDSVNAALAAYQYPQKTTEQIRSYVGNGIGVLIARCLEGGASHPKFEQVLQTFRYHYKENCRNKTKPYDGVKALLRALKTEGRKLAIVSNKADFAVKALNEFYFSEFGMTAIGEREGIKRKPAPDLIYQALKELHSSAEQTVYIGDSEIDVETARNANIPCISVLWGFRSKEELQKRRAGYFAKDVQEVKKLLDTKFR